MSENKVEPVKTRIGKYNNDDERHEAIKSQKRNWYHLNSDKQKLKSLKSYYVKQLAKTDLNESTRTKYESKLNEINNKLNCTKTVSSIEISN